MLLKEGTINTALATKRRNNKHGAWYNLLLKIRGMSIENRLERLPHKYENDYLGVFVYLFFVLISKSLENKRAV